MSDTIHSPETAHAEFIAPFLTARFRARYTALEPGSRFRDELLNKLCHRFAEVLDWRFAEGTGDTVADLRRHGAPRNCYCLCFPPELDGRIVPLADALPALTGGGAFLLVCQPAALAYFEPEYERGRGQRYMLRLPA